MMTHVEDYDYDDYTDDGTEVSETNRQIAEVAWAAACGAAKRKQKENHNEKE